MTRKTKGRDGGELATPKTSNNRNPTLTSTRVEDLIVGAAWWGFPGDLGEWAHEGLVVSTAQASRKTSS